MAEAIHLREAGIDAPIHVFTETPLEAVERFVELRLTPTVYTEGFARMLSDAARRAGERIAVHVKLDTGMHRVGLTPDDVRTAIERLRALPGIDIEGAWSHLALTFDGSAYSYDANPDLRHGISSAQASRRCRTRPSAGRVTSGRRPERGAAPGSIS